MFESMTRGVTVLLLATAFVGGCAGESEELELGGRTFTSTEVRGHSLVDGTTIRLSFEDDAISAQAGCNTMVGGVSWSDGVLVTDGQLAMTMMACDDALSAQDQWLSDLLTSEPAIALDGDTLVLGDDTEGITLTEEQS